MQSTALQWLVYRITGSQLKLGTVTFVGSIPVLLLSLFMGVLVDRFSSRKLLIWTQSWFMLCSAALALITYLDVVKYEYILLIALLTGIANAMDMPARQAIYKDLVQREDLVNAIALNSSVFNGARIIGPAIGGFIVAQLGEAIAFSVNSVSYLAVIFGLFLMTIQPNLHTKSHGNGVQDLQEGMKYLVREKRVFGLVVMIAGMSIVGFSYLTLIPVFAQDVLQIGAEGYGVLLAAQGIGAFTAAISVAFIGDKIHKGKLLVRSRYLIAPAIFFLGFSRSITLTVTALILAGFCLICQMTMTNTLLQLIIPDEFRGRVLSSYTWAVGGFFPIGSLLIGSIGDAIGATNAVMISAGCSLIISIMGTFIFRETWNLE